MFEPRYQISHRLLSTIKRIAVLTAELQSRAIPRAHLMELQDRSAAVSAHTSTRIEGNRLPLTEVRKLLKSRPENLRESEREVVNYNEALTMLRGERPPPSLELVLRVHATVMKDLLEPYHCGRLRAVPVVVSDPRTGETVYLPPDHEQVPALMDELMGFVRSQDLDPVILAGLFHKQLVLIHPFIDGNGRTTRLVTGAILAHGRIDTSGLFSFENFYNRDITRYFEHVGARGSYHEIRSLELTSWLEYFADGILDELNRVSDELRTVSASPDTTLKPHHEKILEHIRAHGFITDRDYSRLTDRAKATRALDFKRLIELGLIERHGRGRNTHYKLVE